LNLSLAILLMIFVLMVGPTSQLLRDFVQNIGFYLDTIVLRTFNIYAYEPRPWIDAWTLFYWAWWISWSPFVGMFIARISRGRTVREFVIAVLFIPAGFTFFWMTVFGNTALYIDTTIAGGALHVAVADESFGCPIPILPVSAVFHTYLHNCGPPGRDLFCHLRRLRFSRRRYAGRRWRHRDHNRSTCILVCPGRLIAAVLLLPAACSPAIGHHRHCPSVRANHAGARWALFKAMASDVAQRQVDKNRGAASLPRLAGLLGSAA